MFREELSILKDLFAGYDLTPFLDPAGDPALRYKLLAKAAEYVFVSTQELQTESRGGKRISKVSFKIYFLKTVKRMRMAYDICQPSGELAEDESALAQCFMAIAGFIRKMNGTDTEVDTDTMNRHVARMVEEALKYNEVENVFEDGEQEDIFSPEYFEKLSDVKMPASKLELLVKIRNSGIAVLVLNTELYDTLYIADRLIQVEQGRVAAEYTRKYFEEARMKQEEIFPD